MIIADIIAEFEQVAPVELEHAIKGLRDLYRVFPVLLQKQMLGEYSNMEYALVCAAHSMDVDTSGLGSTVHEIYVANKV